ncbi:MAG TPA: hypothetical protein VN903_11880 [Polyangia bacterium]|nr:hypothetical protein [Polyangia bacterium]
MAWPLYCHANMKIVHHLAAAVALTAATLAAGGAQAADGPALGISVDGYLAPTWDHSVQVQETGEPERGSRSKLGVATLVNIDELALGGVVDGAPGIVGEGRLTVGGLVGWQPRVGTHRYQLLGEVGQERFSDVGGSMLSTPSVHETWLDYVGARVGVSETLSRDGHFVLGAWFFVRKDLGETTVSNTGTGPGVADSTTTSYVVGGYTAGVAFRIGLRFDQEKRPASEPAEAAPGEPRRS